MKRLINATSKEVLKMGRMELLESIKACEGRVILSENVVTRQGPVGNVTNAEIGRAFGADMILLNFLDVLNPYVYGMDGVDTNGKNIVEIMHRLTGRPIGVNLEPVDLSAEMMEDRIDISKGRMLNDETIEKVCELGFDFVCLTGNPATGVTNDQIADGIKRLRKTYNGIIIAGKMHSSGSDEKVTDKHLSLKFLRSGADIILVPAIGTVPGIDIDDIKTIVRSVHAEGGLVMSAIGTSQESSDEQTIRRIAIDNKIAGVDIQHIGDAGFGGISLPQNIMTLSIAIRGLRHTVAIMSRSVNI